MRNYSKEAAGVSSTFSGAETYSDAGIRMRLQLVFGSLCRRGLPEPLDAVPEAGARGRRQVTDELLPVRHRDEPRIQDADDPTVLPRADQAAEALLQPDLRLGHAVLAEPV